jgi:hypothetical protein
MVTHHSLGPQFHGTDVDLEPGAALKPGPGAGRPGVYSTTDLSAAKEYASQKAAVSGRDPVVYEVQHGSDAVIDFNDGESVWDLRSSGAHVLRRV